MNTKRTPSWPVYFVTLPFVFLSGMTFQSLLAGNKQLRMMERSGEDRERLRQSHQELVNTYKESLKTRDAIIEQLKQRLKDYSERKQANLQAPPNDAPSEKNTIENGAAALPSAEHEKKER